jgi:hypothetical protein
MKTAEEWTSEIIDYELTHYDGSYTKLIKQIQLDAMKEGMRRAAEQARPIAMNLASDSSHIPVIANEISKAILTASEQLTKKDL